MMKFRHHIINCLFALGIVLFQYPAFSIPKLDLKYLNSFVLEQIDYNKVTRFKYIVTNDSILYFNSVDQKHLDLFTYNTIKKTNIPLCKIDLDFDEEFYFIDFTLSSNKADLFLLFDKGVCKVSNYIKQEEIILNSTDFRTDLYFERIYCYENKIILGTCYNEPVKLSIKPQAEFVILDSEKFSQIDRFKISIDAIGLTHLPNYLYDVNFGRIIVTYTLANRVWMYDLNTEKSSEIGDTKVLNDGVDKIPFDTDILANVTNVRGLVQRISEFAKTVNRIEGCFLLSENKFVTVIKSKGDSMYSPRIIKVYTYNIIDNNWKIEKEYSFQNKNYSRKYRMFNFHLLNGFKFIDDFVYLPEFNLAKVPKSKTRAFAMAMRLMNHETVPIAIYRFKHDLN